MRWLHIARIGEDAQPSDAPSAPMPTTELFLIAMTLIFALPYLVWRLGRTDYFAPLMVVQIVTGVVLGPGVLGALFPEYYAFVFPPPVIQSLNGIAWWGVMLFVWIAGVELDLDDAWANRRESGIVAGLALVAPLLTGSIAALVLLACDGGGWGGGWMGAQAAAWQFVLGVGMACAVTALPVLIMLLEKLSILREPVGQRALRYASLDDIAIWAVLALILVDFERIGRQAAFLLAFVPVALGYRALMLRLRNLDRWYVALIWLALCGFGSDWAGLHYMVGAFLAGVVTDRRWFGHEAMDTLRQHLLLLAMPVYFLSTGLRTNWEIGGIAVFGAAALLLAAALFGKFAGVVLAGRILRWGPGQASILWWLLQTKGLVMIVFANVLLDKGLITDATFTALLLMALASTMLTMPVVTPKLRAWYGAIGRPWPAAWGAPAAAPTPPTIEPSSPRATDTRGD